VDAHSPTQLEDVDDDDYSRDTMCYTQLAAHQLLALQLGHRCRLEGSWPCHTTQRSSGIELDIQPNLHAELSCTEPGRMSLEFHFERSALQYFL
jgi:hypothetical protein